MNDTCTYILLLENRTNVYTQKKHTSINYCKTEIFIAIRSTLEYKTVDI